VSDDHLAAVRAEVDARRARAARRREALERDLADIVERSFDASRDDEHDPEGATIAFERAQVGALLDAARRTLAELDEVARRLDEGQLPTCERCGGPIGRERSLARPTARRCVTCAG
jgi:DnaK suppressor protein